MKTTTELLTLGRAALNSARDAGWTIFDDVVLDRAQGHCCLVGAFLLQLEKGSHSSAHISVAAAFGVTPKTIREMESGFMDDCGVSNPIYPEYSVGVQLRAEFKPNSRFAKI